MLIEIPKKRPLRSRWRRCWNWVCCPCFRCWRLSCYCPFLYCEPDDQRGHSVLTCLQRVATFCRIGQSRSSYPQNHSSSLQWSCRYRLRSAWFASWWSGWWLSSHRESPVVGWVRWTMETFASLRPALLIAASCWARFAPQPKPQTTTELL